MERETFQILVVLTVLDIEGGSQFDILKTETEF